MAIITISSKILYYNSGSNKKDGTATGLGTTASAARSAALSAATSAANSATVSASALNSGGSSSTTDFTFGTKDSSSTSIGSPSAAKRILTDPDPEYLSTCSWSKTRTGTIRLLKLKFTLPSGLTASNIQSAELRFTGTANNTDSPNTYYVCGPKSSIELTSYQKFSETTILDKTSGNYNSFTVNTTSLVGYVINITNAFKRCVANNLGWITLLMPTDAAEHTRTITISGSVTISYELNYTACTAPTSVNSNVSIQKPEGDVTISWSGATAGTNNLIDGYTIYYGNLLTNLSSSVDVDSPSTSYTFTLPSNAARGTTYYFKVLTRGLVDGYNSGLSSAQATVKVNSLPDAPTIVSVSPTRIKSTGSTTVTFTVTAGSTNDTGQTASLYYATSTSGTKTPFTSPLTLSLSAAQVVTPATYYFWTYDGLEYSKRSDPLSITKNIAPSITSLTMTPYDFTYEPIVRDGYVKNINGNITVTKDPKATLDYHWYLLYVDGTGTVLSNNSPTENITNLISSFSTTASIKNIDVTSYGATFNTAYRLKVTVIDDIGDSITGYSGTIYAIPAAPTISAIYNRKADSNKGGNTNNSHFEDGIRIKYNENNTGLTRELLYSTDSNFPSFSTISLSETSYSDVTLSNLTRGATYYFRIKYTCNTKTTTSAVSSGYMRALDIRPIDIATSPASGSVIKPYTLSTFNFSFCHELDLIAWKTTQDVANYNENGANPSGIYTIKIKSSVSGSTPITRSMGSNTTLKVPTGKTKCYVSGTISLNNITNSQWMGLFNTTIAPNASYSLTLEITATNGFGKTFIGTKTFTANFVEGVYSIGTPELRIKTGDSTYTKIPLSYNYIENLSGKTILNRYHIFETLELLLSLSGLKCYANQDATIYFMNGTTLLGKEVKVTADEWNETNTSGTSFRYTLNGSKTINYPVPYNRVATDSSNVRNYSVKVVLGNGNSKLSTDSGQSNGNLNTCYHSRYAPSSINFSLSSVTESGWTWRCTNWGSIGSSSNKYSGDYSSVKAQFKISNRADSGYDNLGSLQTLVPSNGSGTINLSLSSIAYDVIYCAVEVTLALNFLAIDSATPTGTKTYSYTYPNLFTLYRATPNLLYGKNFFALNANTPFLGISDQILELHGALYNNNGTTITRNKIYFNDENTYFYLNGNNLEIDCGSW